MIWLDKTWLKSRRTTSQLFRNSLQLLCLALPIALSAPSARGDTTWSNAAITGAWDFFLNWTNGVPDEFDNVTFPDPIPFISVFPNAGTITLPSLAAARSMTLQTGGYNFTGGTLIVDTGVINTASGNSLFQSVITGVEGLTKTGLGSIALAGNNAYFGATTINQGTLDVTVSPERIPNASSVSIASGASLRFFDGTSAETIGSLAGAGTVVFGNTNAGGTNLIAGGDNSFTTFSGDIIQQFGGTGRLTKTGSGQLTLTGNNSYTGGTTISGGILEVDTDSLPTGPVVNNSSLVFNQAFANPFDGDISGSGVVFKVGGGQLFLTGANSYAGGTVLTEGILNVSSDGNLGAASAPVLFDGGALEVQGLVSFAGARQFQIGAGSQAAFDVYPGGGEVEVYGGVTGPGGLVKNGEGALILTSNIITYNPSTYTGGTTINNGTLAVGRDDIFSPVELIPNTSNVSLIGDGRLILQGITSVGGISHGYTETIGGLSGGVNTTVEFFNSAGSHLRVGATNSSSLFAGRILDGPDSASGKLTKIGAGTLTLTGANTYSEGTVIEKGVLVVNSNSLPAAGGVALMSVDATMPELVFDQATNGTYAGVISGAGTVIKRGARTLTLNQNNTYDGSTRIESGVLEFSAESNLGANTSTITFAGGALRAIGSAPVVLSAARSLNTFNGENAVIEAEVNADLSVNGAITGNGGLVVNGPGQVILFDSGSNYAGSTTVNGGGYLVLSKEQGSDERLPNATDLTLNGTAVVGLLFGITETIDSLNGSAVSAILFRQAPGNHLVVGADNGGGTYSGTISSVSGANGRLTKIGSGAQTLTNNVQVTALNANGGSVILNGGNVEVGGTLTVASTGAVDLVNGTLDVDTLDLSAAGSAFAMTGGRLQVGQVIGDLDIAGGALAPGDSPGATTVRGDFKPQLAATLEIELGGANPGQFDLLNILIGSAELNGTLDVKLVNGFAPSPGDAFTFLSAVGGVSGSFASELLPDLGGALALDVVYGANSVTLEVVSSLAGDFDGDGDVDGRDFLVWQRGGSPNPLSTSDLAAWQNSYGTGDPLSANSATVPEPATFASLLAGIAATCFGRRRTGI